MFLSRSSTLRKVKEASSRLGNMALVKLIVHRVQFLKIVLFTAVFYRGTEACVSHDGCPGLNLCCNYVCRSTCANHSCILNSNCGGDFYCCYDTCQTSCVGHSCKFDMDCGAPNEYCCYDTCQVGTCSLAGWVIALIVIAVCIVLVDVGVLLSFCTRRRRPGMTVTAPLVFPGSNDNCGTAYLQRNISTPPYVFYMKVQRI